MANNLIYSELKQYILRKLGSPVVNVEITDDQIEDCIDEAVHEFVENHCDGVNIGFIPQIITKNQTIYQLDDNIEAVLSILSENQLTLDPGDPLLIDYFYPLSNGGTCSVQYDMVDVEIFRQRFQTIRDQNELPILFDYNSLTKKLILHAPPKRTYNTFLKVYAAEEDLRKILTDHWIKKYSVALCMEQWGTNLSKFTSVSLPGGAQFNWENILSMAERKQEKLIEELEDKYSLPLDPIFG